MRWILCSLVLGLFIAGCSQEEPPVDVKALEEPQVGPDGNVIQDD